MAVVPYTVQYIADASSFVAGSRQVANALAAVDLAAARTKAATGGMFGGAGRSAAGAAQKINGLRDALNGVPGPAGTAKAAIDGIGTALHGTNQSVGEFLTIGVALSTAKSAFQEIMDISRQIEQHWKDMAKEATEFRESLRELASIRGHQGPNNTVVADTLSLGLDMGMVPDKAREFAQAYENVGPMVRQKGHYQPAPGQGTAEELERGFLGEAGRTAQRLGIDPKAAADLAGTTGLAHTIHSKEEGMDRFGGAVRGLQKGRLEYTPAVRALNKAAAKLVDPKEAAGEGALPGRLPSIDEAGIYMGAMSFGTGTPDQASHRMIQNSRVLNPSKEKGQKALAAAGITPQMNDLDRLIQLDKYVKAQKIQDVRAWLQQNDLGTETTREGMVAALKAAPELEQDLKANRANPAGKQFMADNDKFMANDRAASAQRKDSISQTIDQVEGEEVEPLERAKKFAESRRRLDPKQKYYSNFQYFKDQLTAPFTMMQRGVGPQGNINEFNPDHGAIPTLEREARRLGIDPGKQFPNLWANDYRTRARAFKEADQFVRDKGGDPMGEKALGEKTRGEVDRMRPVAPRAQPGAANVPVKVAGLDPATMGGAAAGAGGGQAGGGHQDWDKFHQSVDRLGQAAQQLITAGRYINNNRPAPGSDHGGDYMAYRA